MGTSAALKPRVNVYHTSAFPNWPRRSTRFRFHFSSRSCAIFVMAFGTLSTISVSMERYFRYVYRDIVSCIFFCIFLVERLGGVYVIEMKQHIVHYYFFMFLQVVSIKNVWHFIRHRTLYQSDLTSDDDPKSIHFCDSEGDVSFQYC